MSTLKWVYCQNGSKCPSPVTASGDPNALLVAAAYHNGNLLPGSIKPDASSCYVSWYHKSVAKDEYYLLSNPGNDELVWKAASNGDVPERAIVGGYTGKWAETLYIGRINIEGSLALGKVHPSDGVCFAPFKNEERKDRYYEVLCSKNSVPSFLDTVRFKSN